MLDLALDPVILTALAVFLLVGFPVHEFAHAFAAYRLGDGTAMLFGRLTLNPLAHLDPIGSLVLVLSALFGGFFIGWAKPTPVNPSMLRGGRQGEAIVAAAGPLSNLLMATLAGVALRVVAEFGGVAPEAALFLVNVLFVFVLINVALFIFNLVPIPPLDGSRVLFAVLDPRTVWRIRPTLEQWGFVILLVVMLVPIGGVSLGGRVIAPLMHEVTRLLVGG